MSAPRSLITSLVSGVRSVNQKYAKPQIEMTPLVKLALLTLRVYLVVLLGLMFYKLAVSVR